jgi:hypothetical protein
MSNLFPVFLTATLRRSDGAGRFKPVSAAELDFSLVRFVIRTVRRIPGFFSSTI